MKPGVQGHIPRLARLRWRDRLRDLPRDLARDLPGHLVTEGMQDHTRKRRLLRLANRLLQSSVVQTNEQTHGDIQVSLVGRALREGDRYSRPVIVGRANKTRRRKPLRLQPELECALQCSAIFDFLTRL